MEHDQTAFFSASRFSEGEAVSVKDRLAEEVPIALEYNGLSHAVMLATPGDLEDFALGFSLTEGIIADPAEWYGCEIWQLQDGIRIAVEIASERFHGLKERRRNLTGRTGCGICGAESLQHAVRQPGDVSGVTASFTSEALHDGFAQMEAQQQLRKQTGATHAAAWMEESGKVTLLREDVGRHNALDKLIGAMAGNRIMPSGAALVTSRASYEMVQKCTFAGIGILAAVSGPTALAVRMAERSGLTLAGFVRRSGYTVYTRPERIR
ncbi:MAG: formate dehydrogenase accessory sulfurtransferase FdhD [Burkholderiaceae bacterium]|jgi:FdhD protein|nr:formate dehydrogenase accessory sulfurtransferase FdhD [Burkholderiaceae bacterium]